VKYGTGISFRWAWEERVDRMLLMLKADKNISPPHEAGHVCRMLINLGGIILHEWFGVATTNEV